MPTGMTSASMGVALLAGLAELSGRRLLRYELAELASEIERLDKGLAQRLRNAADVYVGEKGIICCSSHGGGPVLLPASRR